MSGSSSDVGSPDVETVASRGRLRASRPPRPYTAPLHRLVAMLVYTAALAAWVVVVGLPNDPIGVFLWFWAAGVAWNIDAPRAYHLRFPSDWWPVLVALTVYWFTRGLADEIGMPVHVTEPIAADQWLNGLFGGSHTAIPTEELQRALCGDPCMRGSDPRWYDLVFSLVYTSHFLVGISMAVVLWVRNRTTWTLWMRRFLAINFAGLVIYFAYPMAPPWMASRDGLLPPLPRITSRGFSDIGLERANIVLQGMANPVAAMPSLHAGVAFLVAFWGIWRLRTPLRHLLIIYPLLMSFALVYFAEHYVIDLIAGGLLAALVMAGCRMWEVWRAGTKRKPQPEHEPIRPSR